MKTKLIVALDYNNLNDAKSMVDILSSSVEYYKVGLELFLSTGFASIDYLKSKDKKVFLDLKFHDIPNTCSKAVKAAAELGVWMVNVHASGGDRMMTASREILEPYGKDRPLLIAVTVLTSMEASDLAGIGIQYQPQQQVLNLALLTKNSGLDGVVCSAQEASLLKAQLGQEFKLITPGIRPVGSDAGDQRRVMTPVEAMAAGSDYLVIGRPITQAKDPAAVLTAINKTLA